jgi:hypothetical protein
MKKIIILSLALVLFLFAEETFLGMVHAIEGDSLVLTDGPKIYLRNARSSLMHKNTAVDAQNISFPFTASLVKDRMSRTGVRTYVRIEQLYEVKEGKLVAKD